MHARAAMPYSRASVESAIRPVRGAFDVRSPSAAWIDQKQNAASARFLQPLGHWSTDDAHC